MSAHFKGENGIKDYMAHKTDVVRSLSGKAPGYFLVFMIFRACPGSKVIEQSLVIGHDLPLLLDWLPFVIHTESATID